MEIASSPRPPESQQDHRQPVGICGDRFVQLSQLTLPVTDAGFVHGVTVAEQVRTFRQRPFLLERHYQRWCRGLAALELQPLCTFQQLSQRIEQLVAMNAKFLPADAEQGVCFFATPGSMMAWNWPCGPTSVEASSVHAQPMFYAHSYPLPVGRWQSSYRQGIDLVTTQIRQVPQECWPVDIKVRSRLHYYLAQNQSRSILNGSYPILLDEHGTVSDSAIGSILGYTDSQGLIVRNPLQRYASISLGYTLELAGNLGINVTEHNFSVAELQSFDEAFLVSTPWCILPVATVDSQRLKKSGFPVFRRLMQAWSNRVGVDILKV